MARHNRNAAEAARLVEAYQQSVLSREEFSKRMGISVSMLDYHRRRHEQKPASGLVRVDVRTTAPDSDDRKFTFSLVLDNGRRIESDWRFSERDLARLIRLAEGV